MNKSEEAGTCKYSPLFIDLYERFYTPIFWFTVKMIKRQEDAEDIVADVFAKLWLNRSKIALMDNMESYLKAMAFNASLDLIRRSKMKRKVKEDLAYHVQSAREELQNLAQIKSEVLDYLNVEMKRLSPKHASIFNLSFVDGLTNEEVATHLKISNQGVRNIKTKIRKRLKASLIIALTLLQLCAVSSMVSIAVPPFF